MTRKYEQELQSEDERETLEQIEVVVELDPSLACFTAPEAPDTQTFKNYLQQHMNELRAGLSLPIEFSLAVRSIKVGNNSRKFPFNVYISERKCWFPLLASMPQDVTAPELARSVAQVIFQNRELCLTTPLAEKIRSKWSTENDANSMNLKEFHKFLLLLVQRAFSIDRGKRVFSLAKTQQDVRAEYIFETTVSDITTLTITAFLNEAQYHTVEDLPDELYRLRKSLFEEPGLILPKVDIAIDQTLEENELGIQFNDLHFPPYRLMWGDGTQPPLWQLPKLIISKLTSELRENAGSFIVGDGVKFLLQRINAPLKESVQARFGVAELTHILRLLLDEGLSVGDLRSILETLISINGTLSIDQSVFKVFSPATANLCPVTDGKKFADLEGSDYANFVRIALKRYISHKYTGGSNNLLVFLLAPEIKTRIKLADKQPLTDQEWGQLIDAVLDAFERPKPSDGNVVILTTFDIRKRLRNLLEKSFPQLAVLSQQELMPDINIQPLGQIFWT